MRRLCGSQADAAGGLTLREARAGEEAFLLAVYASARQSDFAQRPRLSRTQRVLLEEEFNSRQVSYRIDFPGVRYFVIEQGRRRIGRLYLQETKLTLFLVDLIVLPRWRGGGLGTRLLLDLLSQAAASHRSVSLHVEQTNAAAFRLYERLGFQIIETLPAHYLMRCVPPASSA